MSNEQWKMVLLLDAIISPIAVASTGRIREGGLCRKRYKWSRHFTASEVVRDVVIGMSDGLRSFALAAGLRRCDNKHNRYCGLAEIAAVIDRQGLGVTWPERVTRNTMQRNVNAKARICGNSSREMRKSRSIQSYGLRSRNETHRAGIAPAATEVDRLHDALELGSRSRIRQRAMISALDHRRRLRGGGTRPAGLPTWQQ